MENEEKRALCDRLASLENELQRRDDSIQSLKIEKTDLLEELEKSQKKNKELHSHLEEAENAEYDALAKNDVLKSHLEEAKSKAKNETELYHASMLNLQTELNNVKTKLAGRIEEQDGLNAELLDKNHELEEMRVQKERMGLESSSRIANLNQILLQVKQACSQVEIRNEELQEQEKMLMNECETLEKKCESLSQRLEAPCPMCVQRNEVSLNSQTSDGSLHKALSTPIMPIKTIPELTEIDRLKRENEKLSHKHECLLANFQMVSDKSSQAKQEMKENEKAVVDLQNQCDRLLVEKEELSTKYKRIQLDLQYSKDKDSATKRKQSELQEEASCLSKEIEDIQTKYAHLQDQHSEVLQKLKRIQDTATNLNNQVSSLKLSKTENEQALSHAQAKIDELVNEVEKHREESDSSASSADRSSMMESCYHDELKQLRKTYNDLEDELKDVVSHCDRMEDQKIAAESANKKLKTKIMKLESIVKKHEELKQSSVTAADEIVDLRSHLASLSEKNRSLTEELETLSIHKESSSGHVQELKKSVAKYQRESKHSWEMVHRLQKDLETIEDDFATARESLEQKTQECEALSNEMDRMKNDLKTSIVERATLQEDLSELCTKIDHLETSNFELHSRCSEISTSNNASQLTHRHMQGKLEDYQTRLSATQNVLYQKEAQLTEAKTAADMIALENDKLTSQLDHMTQSHTRSTNEVESLRSKLAHYEYDVAVIAKDIAELEKVHLDCEPNRVRLQNKIDVLNRQLQLEEENNEIAKVEMKSLKDEMKRLQQFNDSLEGVVEDLQNKMQLQLTKNDDLSLDSEQKDHKMVLLQEQLNMKCSLIRDLEMEKKRIEGDLERRIELLQEHNETIEGKYYKIHSEYETLLSKHNHSATQAASLEHRLEEFGRLAEEACLQKEKMSQQFETMKEEKGACQKQAETLQAKLKEMKRELHYQKTKLREQERYMKANVSQYTSAVHEFASLRSDALQILSDVSQTTPTTSRPSTTRHRHLSEEVLRSVENYVDS